jgi:long-chain acyl-CoA synthetase
MECLNDMLERNARVLGDKPFLISDDGVLTYAEFDRRTAVVAAELARLGVQRSDRIGLYLPSRPSAVIGFWACQKIGAIPVPMSAMLRAGDLAQAINSASMRAIFVDASTRSMLEAARPECACLQFILDGDAGDPRAQPSLPAIRQNPHDIAALFFTSGTSGLPKGTAQTQLNQYSTLRDMMVFHRTQFGQEVYFCAAPLFTNLGMTVTVNLCMFTGGTVVLHERWDTERVLQAIRMHRVTMLAGTPTMFVYLVNGFDAARHDLSSLRLCTNGGAPVSAEMTRRFEAIAGIPLLQVYGATETLGQNVMEPYIGIRKPGSAGVAVGSSRVQIVDEQGREVARGRIGEVLVSGDCVAAGYWDGEISAPRAFSERGWLSGDLGYVDDDGYLFIVDRKKDVIITGGHNIYPLEVETVLHRHASVAICAVVGVPDAVKGEVPVAVVVAHNGHTPSARLLTEHCRANLSAYKSPRRIYFVDALPVTAGKVRKRELVGAIAEGLLQAAD